MNNFLLTAIVVSNTLASAYVSLRQYSKLKSAKHDSRLFSSSDDWSRSVNYNKEKLAFQIVASIVDTLKDIALLPFLTTCHSFIAGYFKSPAVAFVLFYLILSQLAKVPLTAYFVYVIEEKYGFNKMTLAVFFTDILLNTGLTILIGTPFFLVMFYIIQNFSRFELIMGGFVAIVQVFILWLYPSVIAPLYNKFIPLEDSLLKDKVEALAAKVGFNVGRIDVMDGSKRSGHSNAYFTGFGKTKRIVLYNTLLEHLLPGELLAILAHELGHWHHRHMAYHLVIGCAEVTAYSLAFKSFISSTSSKTIGISFLQFLLASSAITLPVSLISNMISRIFENQADDFAVRLGYGADLKSALIKLHNQNKGTPVIDRVYSAVNFSHPHTIERVEHIDKAMKKKE